MTWYTRVSSDLAEIPDFIAAYESELLLGKYDVKIYGNIEKNVAALPGITEHRLKPY